jgi:hypothetical protein
MKMTMRERQVWLAQIDRIHTQQKQMRFSETLEHADYIRKLKESAGEKV